VKTEADQGSIFSQRFDRSVFIAYFLGAIVPLLALAVVVQGYVLPELSDSLAIAGLVATVCSIAVLSFLSYLVLRRSTAQTLKRIDRDNQRLASLLESSHTMTGSGHAGEIAARSVACAVELSDARAAYLLVRGKDEHQSPELFESAGRDAESHFQAASTHLLAQADWVIENGQPAFLSAMHTAIEDRPPTMLLPLLGEDGPIGILAVVRGGTDEPFESGQVDALNTLASMTAVAMRNAELRDLQRNFFSHITEILVYALDAHLGYHGGHGNRVAQIANRIGRALGWDSKQLQNLHFASRLHDIGMLKFERSVQKSPTTCEKHTAIGGRMLARIRLWEDLAPIVQSHHEWFDGSGYPEGLSGNEIPMAARVIAVCDAFDSMTSDSSYQIAMPLDAAADEIRDGAGTQFDPEVADVFLKLFHAGEITD
jgi:GAF domain-containing protein